MNKSLYIVSIHCTFLLCKGGPLSWGGWI